MTDFNFIVKNTLVANGVFTANSTLVQANNLNVSGVSNLSGNVNISGITTTANINATNISGTITTTSQPNITSNNSTYFNGVTLSTVNTAITANATIAYANAIAYSGNAALAYANAIAYSGNAALAYSNAVTYVAGLSLVNTSQLTSNLSNYASLSSNPIFTGGITLTGVQGLIFNHPNYLSSFQENIMYSVNGTNLGSITYQWNSNTSYSYGFFDVLAGTGAYAFLTDQSGNFTIRGASYLTSDERIKSNIRPLETSVDKLKALNNSVSRFSRNSDLSDTNEHIGFIAQKVQVALPEAVKVSEKILSDIPDLLTVDTTAIIAVLVSSLNEAFTRIEFLESQLKVG